MPDIGQIHQKEYELGLGRSIPVAIAEAPGRIHFLGGQGDPSGGLYLSSAIDRFIKLAVSPRKDNSFRFYAADLNERKRCTLTNVRYRREDRWANYIKAAISLFLDLGYPMRGLNFSICGNIPQNIGLASSAAIESSAGVALRNLLRVQISDEHLAQKLHEAHEKFFEGQASLADYQVCLLARKDHFLSIDSSSGEIIKIKSPLSQFRFLLIDSRVPRLSVENEIISRNADTKKGLEFLSKKFDGDNFKDFGSKDLLDALGDFPEQIRRRSVHIVDEIHRIQDACGALQRSDIASLAKIIFHSHESLRDLYEISCPELDWFVKRAQELEGAAGARMTGRGFGGCIYTIIRRELVEEYKTRLEDYERIFGFRPVIYEFKIATGARILHEKKRVYADTVN
ncbi:MAG: galactokinase [Treponema sp.]|jgi:galactokinase|nr:galactokinase [Treponema sp.]